MSLLTLIGCNRSEPAAPDPSLSIRYVAVVSVYPLADVVRHVAGDQVDKLWELHWFCENGQDPRDLRPTEEQLRFSRRAQLIVTSGFRDPWAGETFNEEQKTQTLVDPSATTAGVRYGVAHGALWLDIGLVKQVTEVVRQHLSVVDTRHSGDYRRNAADFSKELDALESEYRVGLAPLVGKKFLSLRPTWTPLVQRFAVEEVAPVDTDPLRLTDDDVRKLKQTATERNITTLAIDASLLPGVQRDLQLRTGLRLMPLDLVGTSAPDGRSTYVGLMRYNLAQLVEGLK